MMNCVGIRLDFGRRRKGRLGALRLAIVSVIVASSFVSAVLAFDIKTLDESSVGVQPRVFVLSVADYSGFSNNALQGLKYDVKAIKYFFQRHIPEYALKYSCVDPNDASVENVLDAIKKLKEQKIGENDVVFFYYSGHAAYDSEKNDAYFILRDAQGEDQALYRADVKSRLNELNARLVVIFTDCCNIICPLPEGMEYNPEPTLLKGKADECSPIMNRLFVDGVRGIVDLTSSKPGEYSFAYRDGSAATTVAIQTFERLNKGLEDDPSLGVDWRRFVDDWKRGTEDYSERRQRTSVYEQKKQTPYVYELPESVRPSAFSGLAFSYNETTPLKVVAIKKESPASRAGVQVDDVIKSFDGKEIADVKGYCDALAKSADEAELVVLRDGKLEKITLKGIRGGSGK